MWIIEDIRSKRNIWIFTKHDYVWCIANNLNIMKPIIMNFGWSLTLTVPSSRVKKGREWVALEIEIYQFLKSASREKKKFQKQMFQFVNACKFHFTRESRHLVISSYVRDISKEIIQFSSSIIQNSS